MTDRYHTATQELHTVLDMVRWGMSQFQEAGLYYGHGTDNGWDDALALVLHAVHLPHDVKREIMFANLTLAERSAIMGLFKWRIEERIPSAYITHQTVFAGLSFYVDERVLVPRSPLAEIIENLFEPWADPINIHRVLDLCTGSGCIAIACAAYLPEVDVDAVDISKDALVVCKQNIQTHELSSRVNIFEGDLFEPVKGQRYDIIISNPPYVDAQDLAEMPAEFHHEPRLGLEAGHDGLDIVKRILQHAKDHLTPEGILIVEVGNSAAALCERFPEVPFTWVDFQRGGDGVFMLTAAQCQEL